MAIGRCAAIPAHQEVNEWSKEIMDLEVSFGIMAKVVGFMEKM